MILTDLDSALKTDIKYYVSNIFTDFERVFRNLKFQTNRSKTVSNFVSKMRTVCDIDMILTDLDSASTTDIKYYISIISRDF